MPFPWGGGARTAIPSERKSGEERAIFAPADKAFAAAANRGDALQVAVSVHIHYLTPAKGKLEAIGRTTGETDTCSHTLVEERSCEGLDRDL